MNVFITFQLINEYLLTNMTADSCPCGSNNLYQDCCSIFIEKNQLPETAQQLMRSRYSAYTLKNLNYLLTSWHSSTRPNDLNLSSLENTRWNQLYIVKTNQGLHHDNNGSVEFVAYFLNNNNYEKLHEISQFVKEQNKWFYLDGQIISNSNFQPTRNSPCFCGSGKKYKHCCLGSK